MKKGNQNKEEKRQKSLLKKMIEKLDQKMEAKAKQTCCCGGLESPKGNSCCK